MMDGTGDGLPEEVPDGMPEGLPDEMPEEMPDGTAKGSPDGNPDASPDATGGETAPSGSEAPLDHRAVRTAREAEGYLELGLHEEALARAEALLGRADLRQSSIERFAVSVRAECLRGLARWTDGASAFEDLVRIAPTEPAAYVGLGWCQKRAGRLDLAREAMERLLAALPENALGLYNLACYSCLSGEAERALDLLRRSIEREDLYRRLAAKEEDFASLRSDPRFRRLLAEGKDPQDKDPQDPATA